MKKVLVLLFISAASVLLSADPLSKVYSESDFLYAWIEIISIESGISPPSSASPWSGHELNSHLNRIDYQALSVQGREIYNDISRILSGREKPVSYSANIQLSPEGYFNLNKDDITRRDWVYNNSFRKPAVYLESEAVIGENFYGIFTLEAVNRINRMFPSLNEQNLGFGNVHANFLFSDGKLEDSIPFTAYIGVSDENLTFTAGRDTLSWGRGNTGNLFIGNHAPYHDFISFSANNDTLTYRFLAMQSDNIHPVTGKSERFSFGDKVRLFTAHRVEARLTPRLTVAASEGALFYADRLDIRMFSPLVFLHNYMNFDEAKNFMQFEIEFLLMPGAYLYSQLFIDQIQLPGEVATYKDYELFPNAFGALAGVNFSKPIHNGYISGFFEAVLTSTYLYLRRNDQDEDKNPESPSHYWTETWNLDLVHATNLRDRNGVSFFGYRYGPDSIITAANVSYRKYKHYSVAFDLLFGIQGDQGLEIDGKDQYVETGIEYLFQYLPSGQVEYLLISGISGEYWVPGLPLKIHSQINTINRWNNLNQLGENIFDIQVMLGAVLKLNIL